MTALVYFFLRINSTFWNVLRRCQFFFLKFQPVSDPSLPLLSASEIRRVMEDLEDANVEKDQLMQKCHNLEIQVNLLQDEKNNITAEYELLQKEV